MSSLVDAPTPARFSRRSLAVMTSVGALAGGVWTVGLASVLRSAEPDLTILGNDEWQVMLLETGMDRILLLVGAFQQNPGDQIQQLLSTLRQHVDVIVATGSAIANLDRTGRLASAPLIQLDAEPNQTDSLRTRALRQRLVIEFRDGSLDLRRIPNNEWSVSTQKPADWVIDVHLGDLVVTIGPRLELAARASPATSAMLIAPDGDVAAALSLSPGISLVANGVGLDTGEIGQRTAGGYLVRTFPRDSTRLRIVDGRISLPSWAQPIADLRT